jgi:hypothetical protein
MCLPSWNIQLWIRMSGRICCTLKHVSPVHPPEYVALSSCWGDASITKKIMIDGVPVEPGISIATFSSLLFMYLGRCNLHQSNKTWARGVNSFCRCDLSIKELRGSLLGLARRLAILIWMWTSSKISTLVPCHKLRPNIHWLPNQLSYTFWNSPIGERSGWYKKLPCQDLQRCTAVVWISPGNHWH